MPIFLSLIAIVWIAMGLGTLATAKSVMHEMLAALLFSFAVVFIALAGVTAHLKKLCEKSSAGALIARMKEPGDDRQDRSLDSIYRS